MLGLHQQACCSSARRGTSSFPNLSLLSSPLIHILRGLPRNRAISPEARPGDTCFIQPPDPASPPTAPTGTPEAAVIRPNCSDFMWRARASTPRFAAHPWQPHAGWTHPGRSKILSSAGDVRSKEQLLRNALGSRELPPSPWQHNSTCREAYCGNRKLLLCFLYLPAMQQPRRALAERVPPPEGGCLLPARVRGEKCDKTDGRRDSTGQRLRKPRSQCKGKDGACGSGAHNPPQAVGAQGTGKTHTGMVTALSQQVKGAAALLPC